MSHTNPERTDDGAIRSTLADDPEMIELVEYFVSELAGHSEAILQALDDEDVQTLRRLSHQLKGAAGGYGFGVISEAAARVEAATLDDEAALNELRETAENLITLCRRATV